MPEPNQFGAPKVLIIIKMNPTIIIVIMVAGLVSGHEVGRHAEDIEDELLAELGPTLPAANIDKVFEYFKNITNRRYHSLEEEVKRKAIFIDNLQFILRHNLEANADKHSYRLGLSSFTDMTSKEFVESFRNHHWDKLTSTFEMSATESSNLSLALPDSVDWTSKGVVTLIKGQGQCGSCWAFSAVASIEGQQALRTGRLVSLSEQNLLDCAVSYGCQGGFMTNAFEYVIRTGGIDTETSYPYRGAKGQCRYNPATSGAKISSFVNIARGREDLLKAATANVGPISVAIDAGRRSFQHYRSGVYFDPTCSPIRLNHGVTVVGYGTANRIDYWKVKNSWGTVWGERGYIRMARNRFNMCGIATQASYPVI